jgi:hypothetical protein
MGWRTGLSPTHTAWLWYILEGIEAEDASWFFQRLVDGVDPRTENWQGPADQHPITVLRNTLLKLENPLSRRQLGFNFKLAITIKAWNAWRQGRSIARVTYRAGGSRAEAWPLIDGELTES